MAWCHQATSYYLGECCHVVSISHSYLTILVMRLIFWDCSQWWHINWIIRNKFQWKFQCKKKYFSSLRLRQNGRHFAGNTFKCIFFNENVRILINVSMKFVPKGPIDNIPALVLIMAWRRPGDKTLSEPMMVSLLTYICVTLPQLFQPQNVDPWSMITAAHAVCSIKCSLIVFKQLHP